MYCASTTRDRSIICIVEEPYNLVAVEKTRSFKGLYHILHGSLSPIRGIGPDELMLANLMPRLMPNNNKGVEIKEIIVARIRRPKAKRRRITSPGCWKPLRRARHPELRWECRRFDLEFVDE
jgi:recombination protein RecR